MEVFDDDEDDVRYGRTEMDRFTDAELEAIFNDPGAGGVVRKALNPILKSEPGNAIDEADAALSLLRRRFPEDTDPLFFDWQFIYAFVSKCRFINMARDRVKDVKSNPITLMSMPAFAMIRYGEGGVCIARPFESWMRAAESVSWEGVLPVTHSYQVGSQECETPMVALKISPIWHRLGLAGKMEGEHEPYSFNRKGNRDWILINVGNRELVSFCNAAKIPDMMPKIVAVAKRLHRKAKV